VALVGSFPAYGRGLSRSFSKIEIVMGDTEFTLFYDYLKRYNSYKRLGEPVYHLKGLEDVSLTFQGTRCKSSSFNRFGGHLGRMVGLAETLYLLAGLPPGLAPPLRFEVTVVSQLTGSPLRPGHEHHECLARHPPAPQPTKHSEGCREAYHAVGFPWSKGPAFALAMIQRAPTSTLQQAIYGHEYFGLSSAQSVFRLSSPESLERHAKLVSDSLAMMDHGPPTDVVRGQGLFI